MKIKNLILGVGIVVVFALVLWQGIQAFYPSPQWEDFCGAIRLPVKPAEPFNQTTCEEKNGIWKQDYCDFYTYCQEDYETKRNYHAQIAFFISLIVALLAIILGFTFLKIEPVGSALLASGVWAIFYGTVINWSNFTTVIRFVLLLVALILLIWIAIRLNKPKKKK
jgi:hypothetical protein